MALIGIHTLTSDVVAEMQALVDVHTAVKQHWSTDNILIMGDMNADCSYLSATARNGLTLRTNSQFSWLIGDEVDTTTTSTDCAYDRCVLVVGLFSCIYAARAFCINAVNIVTAPSLLIYLLLLLLLNCRYVIAACAAHSEKLFLS